MSGRVSIDSKTYEAMLDFVENIRFTDRRGNMDDTCFIQDDFWLQDTVVIENVEKRHGAWDIFLVFAQHNQPLKFIKRRITNFASEKKAVLTGHYMRRLAAKDQRGTLKINIQVLGINLS